MPLGRPHVRQCLKTGPLDKKGLFFQLRWRKMEPLEKGEDSLTMNLTEDFHFVPQRMVD